MLRAKIVLAVALCMVPAAAAVSEDSAGQYPEAAKTLVAQMAAGQFDKAVERFDRTMKQALPKEKLKEVWNGVRQQFGLLQRATETRTEKGRWCDIVFVTCEFPRGKLDTKVVFNSYGKIAGLFFVPSGQYKLPAYADCSQFEEKKIQVGKGLWSLPGTLSLPKGDGPLPAVILVHGSGPNDRDESIGPNKPFRDLAAGLASRGVAVLRYEKRTKHYSTQMALSVNSLTVQEETIDDAGAAVEALSSEAKIDAKRIFVLGHSLGERFFPESARNRQGIAGFISFAGSTRPLEDVVLDQTRYILSLDGKLTAEAQQTLEHIQEQVAEVKSPTLSENTPKDKLPLGIPGRTGSTCGDMILPQRPRSCRSPC